MAFAMHHHNGNHTAAEVLTVKIKLCDGSYLTARMEDTDFVFTTGLHATSRFALSEIMQLKNVSHTVTLRNSLRANKFEIYYRDENRIVGVPKSPQVIHLNGVNAPHTRGDIPLWKVDWLMVLPHSHNAAEATPDSPALPAHSLGVWDRLLRYFRIRQK
jgi:hypothetical protein